MEPIDATVCRALNPSPLPISTFFTILSRIDMGNDAVLTKSLVLLAAVTVFTGLYTQSLTKMGATYLYGMLLICGVALPDWRFFSRPFSQWCDVVAINNNAHHLHEDDAANYPQSRLKLYPVRVVMYTAVYGFGFYKWWHFITG